MSTSERCHDDGRVPVWSVAVRFCHWGLAACILYDWFLDDGGPMHRWVGYAAVGVVLLRWLVGLVQPGAARLAHMLPSLRGTLSYLRALLRGRAPRHDGHDPLGLWMVWLLWALVLALGATGWLLRTDRYFGDEFMQGVHALLADAMAASVLLHLAGVALMSWQWRENLPWAMVTGRKRAHTRPPDRESVAD